MSYSNDNVIFKYNAVYLGVTLDNYCIGKRMHFYFIANETVFLPFNLKIYDM